MSFLLAEKMIDGNLYLPNGNGKYYVAGIDRFDPQQRITILPGDLRTPRKGGQPYRVFSIIGEQEIDFNVGTDDERRGMIKVVTQGFIDPEATTASIRTLASHLISVMDGPAADQAVLDSVIRGGF